MCYRGDRPTERFSDVHKRLAASDVCDANLTFVLSSSSCFTQNTWQGKANKDLVVC